MGNPAGENAYDEKLKWHTKRALKRFPELALLKNNHERNQAVDAAKQRTFVAFGIAVGVTYLVTMITLRDLETFLGIQNSFYLPVIHGAVAGIGVSFLYQAVYGKRVACAIRKKINELGTPVCIECGYLLKALTQRRCPECGTPCSCDEANDTEEHAA